jgi:hypothetical protein
MRKYAKNSRSASFKGLLTLIVFFLRLQGRVSGSELIPVNPRGLWEILRNFAGMKQKSMLLFLCDNPPYEVNITKLAAY